MENILDIIAQIVGIAFGSAVIYAVTIVCPQITEWFLAKIATIKNDALRKAVEDFCESVEQTLKDIDPTGNKRREEVYKLLNAAGYEINDFVKPLVEATVYKINLNNSAHE